MIPPSNLSVSHPCNRIRVLTHLRACTVCLKARPLEPSISKFEKVSGRDRDLP